MLFAVIDHRCIDPMNVVDVGEVMNSLSVWLAEVKNQMRAGTIKAHYAFKGGHGGITIYDVPDQKALHTLLAEQPYTAEMVHREILELVTLDEALANVSRYMIGV